MTQVPNANRILDQLNKIEVSKTFQNVTRQTELLRFLVKTTVERRSEDLKGSVIAQQLFSGEEGAFRSAAGRLRTKLLEYYHIEGAPDPIRIDIPKGGYIPTFTLLSQTSSRNITDQTASAAVVNAFGRPLESGEETTDLAVKTRDRVGAPAPQELVREHVGSQSSASRRLRDPDPSAERRVGLRNFLVVSGSSGNSRFYDEGLPPLQTFFGRAKEWAALDKAYKNPRTRLAIISGPVGGEGKSQLAHRWLSATFEKSRRGLQIFTFSFNSQGTTETRQTSSDPFFNTALPWFGVQANPKALAEEKAEQLAHAIVRERAILYLDGTEPLQYEPTGGAAPLRQRAMRVLLRNLACIGNHFCIISTRSLISELKGDPGVAHISLKGLDPGAAIDLLKHYGVRSENEGRTSPLRKLAKRWDYHPLSLVLLSTYLAKYFEGDVRGLDTIRELRKDVDSPSVPYRPELMLAMHERRLAENNQGALQLLRVMGLFDRPLDENWVSELTDPPIPEVSNKLRSNWLSPDLRNATLRHLVDLGLISTREHFLSRHIHCHALIQQYQGQLVRARFRNRWRQAHARLFRYFASFVQEPRPKTADEMQTLYQAVAHGCAAGQFKKAFDEVYWTRISRETEWFSTDALGLVAEDLACLASFFDRPFSRLVKPEDDTELGAHIFSLVGFRLRTQGRLKEAEFAMEQALARYSKLGVWEKASGAASNIAVLHRMQGKLGQAVAEGKKAVQYAESAKNARLVIHQMAVLGEFQHYRGDLDGALALFKTAEKEYASRNPEDPFLHSTIGFRYCELLLTLGRTSEVMERARNIPVKDTTRYLLLDRALSGLCEARALMARGPNKRELSRVENLLRESLELAKKSGLRDNQIRVAIALSECLRLKGKDEMPEAASVILDAIAIADWDKMYLHRLDCEFEYLQIQLATQEPQQAKRKLIQLSKKARKMGYGLLSLRTEEVL